MDDLKTINAINVSSLDSEFCDVGCCFINVNKQVKKFGGRPQMGWLGGTLRYCNRQSV